MKLIRNIHEDRIKKALFVPVQRAAEELDITLVAEGIETIEEYYYLGHNGVELMQGYLFQKPESSLHNPRLRAFNALTGIVQFRFLSRCLQSLQMTSKFIDVSIKCVCADIKIVTE